MLKNGDEVEMSTWKHLPILVLHWIQHLEMHLTQEFDGIIQQDATDSLYKDNAGHLVVTMQAHRMQLSTMTIKRKDTN